jgi:hypothetical protein
MKIMHYRLRVADVSLGQSLAKNGQNIHQPLADVLAENFTAQQL